MTNHNNMNKDRLKPKKKDLFAWVFAAFVILLAWALFLATLVVIEQLFRGVFCG